jgi:hypothetical protein
VRSGRGGIGVVDYESRNYGYRGHYSTISM